MEIDYDSFIKKVWHRLAPNSSDINSIQLNTLFSIIIPVYNTNPEYLRACLNSVLSQSYTKWELCIVDDASTNPHTREVLHEFENLIPNEKYKVHYRQTNGHICQASNDENGEWLYML